MSLNQLLATVLKVDEQSVTEDTSAKNLKAWNSLRHVELVMAIEKQYQLRFTAAEVVALQSVRQIREILGKRGMMA
jgi:acyl carrier protein